MFPANKRRHLELCRAFFASIVLAAVVPTALDAQTTQVTRIEIVASGTYEIEVASSSPDASVVG